GGIDLGALLAGLDFITFIFDTEPPFDILGEGLGVSCHSSPAQDDCAMIFENIGLDTASGDANPATNAVFHKR
ncbi:MAG: metallo-mystery pair system four-Cys motif protein, partial [Myxococcota bacterium]